MATLSTVPAAMEALYCLLAATPSLETVQVSESFPGVEHLNAKSVWIGEVNTTSITTPVMRHARVPREEQYSLDVFFQSSINGTTAKAAREDVFALYGALEDLTATDPTLGGIVVKALPVNFQLTTTMNVDGGWTAQLRVEVGVMARIY